MPVSAPRILCISLSPLTRDARVLRQIDALARHGEVTTVGYGPAPAAATEHLQVEDSLNSLPRTPLGVLKLATRRLHSAELDAPGLRRGLELVGDRTFDLVVANDARSLPLAHRVARGAPVWADMHEWAAEEFSHVRTWRLLVGPLMEHVCREYLPRSAAVTTVCEPLADRYTEHYGVPCEVIRNAGPWRDLAPTPVADDRIRLVHSGAAIRGRNLEMLIEATLELPQCTLDLYLVPAADGGRYLAELERLAGGSDRITIHDPVAPADLPATLNAYDVGAFCMPPINVNAEYALPNKFFDFVQARLAHAVGPAPEMARLVRHYDLGVVSTDFDKDSFVTALKGLDAASVRAGKQASHEHAHDLSSERDVLVVDGIVERLLSSGS
ncbi:glycosyltransferase family 4 protein [Knoellia sp. DB2414S]|uniref:Glycosyltransferase family 4 protein n=1 Tax=Knoellia koreensis TaxID=2730921 RepID=A0A849HG62_9MICO|nr:glycosyltransferase family 4 protein [Knoellia sp. DB2414S]